LGEEIMNRVKTLVFLKSPVSDEMLSHMKNFSGKIETCETLQEAVQKAHIDAQEGDSVLFSPAGEYFVYFKDKMPGYKNFRHIVESLD
jgi:UDP-N-acetylmuramoylalanine-D-glutamate ligase